MTYKLIVKIKLKTYYFPLFTALIILIKSFLFPCQDDFVKQRIITPYLSEKLQNKTVGKWEGIAKWELIVFENSKGETIDSNLTWIISNPLIEECIKPDTIFNFYDDIIRNVGINQKIVKNEINITVEITDSTIIISGIEHFYMHEYKLYHVEPSFNPILLYNTDKISENLFSESDNMNFKFDKIFLNIIDLKNKKLSGLLNGIYLIELNKL